MTTGAILLLGGRSTRMGAAKAALDWHGVPLAAHVAAQLAAAVDGPVIAVAAPDQVVPDLPAGVELARDRVADEGPLRALEAGLAALEGRAERAVVVAVDLPLMVPAVVAALAAALGPEDDAAVPVLEGRLQPLAAAYRVDVLRVVRELLAAGERSMLALTEAVRTRQLDATALRSLPGVSEADPDLRSLRGANSPDELARLRRDG